MLLKNVLINTFTRTGGLNCPCWDNAVSYGLNREQPGFNCVMDYNKIIGCNIDMDDNKRI